MSSVKLTTFCVAIFFFGFDAATGRTQDAILVESAAEYIMTQLKTVGESSVYNTFKLENIIASEVSEKREGGSQPDMFIEMGLNISSPYLLSASGFAAHSASVIVPGDSSQAIYWSIDEFPLMNLTATESPA